MQVRSLELDTKEWSETLVSMMMQMGNSAANSIWLKSATSEPGQGLPIAPESTSAQREVHIRQKYEARAFVGNSSLPAGSLHVAALTDDVVSAAK